MKDETAIQEEPRTTTALGPASADELEMLVQDGHGHPHALPGPHVHEGAVNVRIFQPLAKTVRVNHPGAKVQENVDLDHERSGVWVGTLPVKDVPGYRVRVDYGQGEIQTDDPYRFLPTLGEMNLHLINVGRHEQLWTVLGAHRHVFDGFGDRVEGTSFAACAPSAKGVRIKGDFTAWDGREHPMRELGSLGVWELFVPDVGSGTKRKFLILGAEGQWRVKPTRRRSTPRTRPPRRRWSSSPPIPGPTTTG